MAKPINPDEEREREAQGRALLEAVRQMRAREARQREWLREQISKGLDEKEADAADERARRDEER
jgi:hypothetical protein